MYVVDRVYVLYILKDSNGFNPKDIEMLLKVRIKRIVSERKVTYNKTLRFGNGDQRWVPRYEG